MNVIEIKSLGDLGGHLQAVLLERKECSFSDEWVVHGQNIKTGRQAKSLFHPDRVSDSTLLAILVALKAFAVQ